jgi:hypothetical protein
MDLRLNAVGFEAGFGNVFIRGVCASLRRMMSEMIMATFEEFRVPM